MNEFLKLSWRVKAPSDLEQQTCFLTEETIADSYIYKSFVKSLTSNNNKKSVKLRISQEKYVPGKKCFKSIAQRSLLTKNQKSICLKALKLLQSGKKAETLTSSEQYSLHIYKECHQKIVEENARFLDIARRIWEKNNTFPLRIRPAILNYSRYHWRQRMTRYLEYPRRYKEISMIGLNYSEEAGININFEHVGNLLEMGTLARFAQPNLKEMCSLKIISLPNTDENQTLNSKLPVSCDENIKKLLESNRINVVISSSVLKQIIDYTDTKSKWTIPVIVKDITMTDRSKNKVVFMDKVLPKTNPSYHDLKYYAYKQLVKTNCCQYEAFTFPDEECPLTANQDVEEDNIFEEIPEDESNNMKTKNGRQRVIHHNVSYRLWKVQKIGDQNNLMKTKVKDKDISLLVRCKLDACECTEQGILQPVVIKPKLEHQLQYGANIATKSELAKEWASLFFRLYSNLYRARIYVPLSEVISVEKCSLQKINTEASTHYDYKPLLGLGVLQKVMEELTELEVGNYILQHLPKHEGFVSVMKQCEEKAENCYDLHSEYDNGNINSETKLPWLPIDTNYILPVHEELEQMPAMFQGFDKLHKSKEEFNSKVNRKKKKKKKKKGKSLEVAHDNL